MPVLDNPARLSSVLRSTGARVVVVAEAEVSDRVLIEAVRACQRSQCEVFLVPRLYELSPLVGDMELLWGMPLFRLRRSALRSPSWRCKRLLDLCLVLGALVVLAPVMAVCALAVRLEGGPGVIFRQERVGMDGRRFELMKFRSMRPESRLAAETTWSIAGDARVGPVGRFLRVTSLDELPQLVNILRGDMSLVGPRPERPTFVQEFAARFPEYPDRHRVPCGLTGWAQIHGLRGATSIDDRARFDNFYIENWSLWLDLKILLRTAVSVISQPGA